MSPSPSTPRRAAAGNVVTKLLVTLVVLALAAAVVFLLSQLNVRTYTLDFSDGKLTVMKGRLLPMGAEPFRPADPVLAEAYAPLDLQGHSPGPLTEARFTERDELDRTLFGLMESIARPRVISDDPKQLEQGLAMLRRMEKLPGITQDQRKTLKALEAEVAFYQARMRLDDARRSIADALTELKISADSGTHNSRSAHQMVSAIEPAATALEEALRHAVHTLSAPAEPSSLPPVPAPAASEPPAAEPSAAPAAPTPAAPPSPAP